MLNKKPGITNAIREKLGFADEGLWKKFSARRLELIDALDLSSRRASDQEDNVKNVAHILRAEFSYGPDTFEDFEALVRAAVQSVRRNRKRCSKTGRANKRPRTESSHEPETPKSQFLSEIAHIADTQDSVYDMSYSTKTVVSTQDRSRAAIDTIIRPYVGPLNISAPTGTEEGDQTEKIAQRERALQSSRNSFLLYVKRSKLCLLVTMLAKNELFRVIGQAALSSVCMLMLEMSFGGLNKTSFEHIREKITSISFQAKFYNSLEPSSSANALNDDTAAATLHTLIGCCIQDFGFDAILHNLGQSFYQCILLEYPLVANTCAPFKPRLELPKLHVPDLPRPRSEFEPDPRVSKDSTFTKASSYLNVPGEYGSLENLATIASKLGSGYAVPANETNSTSEGVKREDENTAGPSEIKVSLRFLSASLNFTFPAATSAPPRFNEVLDNGRQAFKLTHAQNYGLRNYKTGTPITDDSELERLFASDQHVDLEIHALRGTLLPLRGLVLPKRERLRLFPDYHTSELRIILPPPVEPEAKVPVIESAPRFQPLL